MQFKSDSIRAANWAKQTGDSARWLKYQSPAFRSVMMDTLHRIINQQLLQDMQKAAADKPKDEIKAPQPDSVNN